MCYDTATLASDSQKTRQNRQSWIPSVMGTFVEANVHRLEYDNQHIHILYDYKFFVMAS